jgi:hypothetical protein
MAGDSERAIELTDQQLERAWGLTCALVANEGSTRRSLDQLFIAAARFVERVDGGFHGDGALLDSGKGGPAGKLSYVVKRRA